MPLRLVPSFETLSQSIFVKPGFSLLGHQKKAVKWMFNRENKNKQKKGGILADEMGVGKTIETIGLIVIRPVRNTLIIVPSSLISQWASEIEKFTDNINVSLYKPNRTECEINIVITSFVKSTYPCITDIHWDRIVIDEAHILRNPKGKTYKKICCIPGTVRWCLTGTPIQNYISDIKSLFRFIGITKIDDIKQTIDRYLFRRTKKEVNITLSGIEEHEHIFEFKSLYEKEMYKKLDNNIYESLDVSFLERLLRLRQSTILPQLVIDGYNKKKIKNKTSGWKYNNTKISEIVKTLETNPDEKPVVFCYFRKEIMFLQDKLSEKNIDHHTIDGRVSMGERSEIINNSESFRVLIVQIMAGSVGLNLQKFNSVYFSGPHWNPTHEQQAIARVYRIGQHKKVTVRRFIIKNTIEEKIQQIQKNKLAMINELI